MPPATPSSIRKMMQERARAGRQARASFVQQGPPQRASSTASLLSRILPAKVANALNYAKSHPARVAAHSLPFGLGALIGISGEAELARKNNALMIASARGAARRSQPSAQVQSPLRVFSSASASEAGYRIPSVRPNEPARKVPRIVSLRTPPPLSSRPLASRVSENFAAGVVRLTNERSVKALTQNAPSPRRFMTYRRTSAKSVA